MKAVRQRLIAGGALPLADPAQPFHAGTDDAQHEQHQWDEHRGHEQGCQRCGHHQDREHREDDQALADHPHQGLQDRADDLSDRFVGVSDQLG